MKVIMNQIKLILVVCILTSFAGVRAMDSGDSAPSSGDRSRPSSWREKDTGALRGRSGRRGFDSPLVRSPQGSTDTTPRRDSARRDDTDLDAMLAGVGARLAEIANEDYTSHTTSPRAKNAGPKTKVVPGIVLLDTSDDEDEAPRSSGRHGSGSRHVTPRSSRDRRAALQEFQEEKALRRKESDEGHRARLAALAKKKEEHEHTRERDKMDAKLKGVKAHMAFAGPSADGARKKKH